MSGRLVLFWLAALALGCATLADGEAGLDNPPSARAGPFRLLKIGEIGQERAAPYVMDDQKRGLADVSVVDADGDPSTPAVEGYFSARPADAPADSPPSEIVRVLAADGRSFERTDEVVLVAGRPWEGGTVGAPSVINLGRTRRIYYAAAGGIGMAESTDGAAFHATDAPLLGEGAVPWADGPPRSPGIARLPDDSFVLFFEADRGGRTLLGLARSADGVTWTAAPEPALGPGGPGALDEAWVGTPQPVVARSAQDRDVLYLYYGARAADGKQVIGLAASFLDGDEIELERSAAAMYTPSTRVQPREPSVVRFDTFTLLFVTQLRGSMQTDLVVPAGVSPGNAALPTAQ